MKNQFDAIIVLSFGRGQKVNKYLGEIFKEIYNEHKIPYMLQKEIFYAIVDKWTFPNDFLLIEEHRQKGRYLDTYEVLRQARNYLDKHNGFLKKKIILVAHPLHFYRAKYIAEKIGFEVSEGRVDKCLYDKKDPQIWTRNCLFFWIWNTIAWIKVWLKYL